MKEINDSNLEMLHEHSQKVFLKNKTSERPLSLEEAVVLSIFYVFSPDNSPMSEDEVQTIFSAYQQFLSKKLNLN